MMINENGEITGDGELWLAKVKDQFLQDYRPCIPKDASELMTTTEVWSAMQMLLEDSRLFTIADCIAFLNDEGFLLINIGRMKWVWALTSR